MDYRKIWLVEISLKSWIAKPEAMSSRVVSHEEVLATGELNARMAGFYQFARRCEYEPAMRMHMGQWGLTSDQCCAPDAVQLD